MAPYTAVAFFKFADGDSKMQFTKALNKLISFVEKEEPDTLVYSFLEDKENPLGMMGYEVWKDMEAFTAHCETEPFKEFVEVFGPLAESGKVKVDQKFSDKEMVAGFSARG